MPRWSVAFAHQLVKPKGFFPDCAPISLPARRCLPLGVMIASRVAARLPRGISLPEARRVSAGSAYLRPLTYPGAFARCPLRQPFLTRRASPPQLKLGCPFPATQYQCSRRLNILFPLTGYVVRHVWGAFVKIDREDFAPMPHVEMARAW